MGLRMAYLLLLTGVICIYCIFGFCDGISSEIGAVLSHRGGLDRGGKEDRGHLARAELVS